MLTPLILYELFCLGFDAVSGLPVDGGFKVSTFSKKNNLSISLVKFFLSWIKAFILWVKIFPWFEIFSRGFLVGQVFLLASRDFFSWVNNFCPFLLVHFLPQLNYNGINIKMKLIDLTYNIQMLETYFKVTLATLLQFLRLQTLI